MHRPYTNQLGCPMCGEMRLLARFCTGETTGCITYFHFSSVLRVSHIHRICNNCSYEWYESPKGYDPSQDARICAVCMYSAAGGAEANCGHYVCLECALPDEPSTEACPLCYEKEDDDDDEPTDDPRGDPSNPWKRLEEGGGMDDDVVPSAPGRSEVEEEVVGAL